MKECIFCGSKDDLTREHIIPKAIFRGGNFNNLIVLPSCRQCNNSYKNYEDKFITFLQVVRGIEKPDIFGKLKRQFANPKLKREQEFFRENFGYKELDGVQRMYVKLDEEAMKKVILKICIGLNQIHFGDKLTWDDYEIVIHRKNSDDLSEVQQIQKEGFLNSLNWSTLEKGTEFPGYFFYEYQRLEQNMNIFKLIFYEDIEFYVITF